MKPPGDATGSLSATTALTKTASDLVRFAAKALRQVTRRERDRPYRRAVATTRRGSDRLSKTIRAFSSSDQRRRRPVSTTSSRFSASMAVHTCSSQPSDQPAARRLSSEAYVFSGEDDKIEAAFISTANDLLCDGAVAITGNCGFSIKYQNATTRQSRYRFRFPPCCSCFTCLGLIKGRVGILTFDSRPLTPDLRSSPMLRRLIA